MTLRHSSVTRRSRHPAPANGVVKSEAPLVQLVCFFCIGGIPYSSCLYLEQTREVHQGVEFSVHRLKARQSHIGELHKDFDQFANIFLINDARATRRLTPPDERYIKVCGQLMLSHLPPMSETAAPAIPTKAVALLLGPFLIGSGLDIFLQGVLSCQFVHYHSWYDDDPRALRLVVLGLAIATYLKTIQVLAVVWIKFVVFYSNFGGAIGLSFTAWWESGNALMVAAIGLYVQTYFCYRLWVITKRKWYIVLPIWTMCIFGFLAVAVVTHYIDIEDILPITPWFATHMASVFGGDVLLTGTTAYFLLSSRKEVLPQTAGFINQLLRLTFQTAAPATLCALLYLIFSQLNISSGTPAPSTIMTIFNMPLPKLYGISMMWTLNARRAIRAASSHHGMTGTSNEISGGRSRQHPGTAHGDVELGRIHVLTQTSQHIDVNACITPLPRNTN
ncbi:hypothetical protein C8R46DRAFT_981778 [Mycena filopes]|nr:hypothetical protein C8R46DRAFT_981778 [Mycena filopes]